MGSSSIGQILVTTDEHVKASATDPTAGKLDAKVDGTTITVNGSEKLQREALTGDVTTVGNAATVVTNANLTGVVTSVGNATSIADKALAIAKLADGTDGELITWDASGVIDTVAAGTADQVLTSNGPGAAPTFQTPAGGGGYSNVIYAFQGYDDNSTANSANGFHMTFRSSIGAADATNLFFHSYGNTNSVAFPGISWIKTSTVNTITCYWRGWTASLYFQHYFKVGTLQSASSSNYTDTTPTDRGPLTLDVSSLSDGTKYDIAFYKNRPQPLGGHFYLSELYFFGS